MKKEMIICGLVLFLGLHGIAAAAPFTFSASSGNLAASAAFDVSGPI